MSLEEFIIGILAAYPFRGGGGGVGGGMRAQIVTPWAVAEGSNAPCMDVTGQQRSEMLHA